MRARGVLYEQIPMPYDWIDEFILVRVLRRSDRFNILLGIPLGLLAALGWQQIFAKQRRWLGWLWIAVILFEALPIPFPTIDSRITPPWYETLAEEPGDFAILDFPFSRIPQKLSMYYQLTHDKALATGKIARIPTAAYEFILSVPILADLQIERQVNHEYEPISRTLGNLARNNIRYIVIHKTGIDSGQSHDFANWLGYRPTYEDDLLAVYSTSPQLGIDYDRIFEFSAELGLIKVEIDEIDLQLEVVWHAQGIPQSNQQICVGRGEQVSSQTNWGCYPIGNEWPLARWSDNEMVRQTIDLSWLDGNKGGLLIGVAPAGSTPAATSNILTLP